nr:MAG TPA: hypothetical protein [Bacteriophage sp.]
MHILCFFSLTVQRYNALNITSKGWYKIVINRQGKNTPKTPLKNANTYKPALKKVLSFRLG